MKEKLLRYFHCNRMYLIFAMMLFGNHLIYAQSTLKITGVVKDSTDNSSLPGVTVIVRGTSNGVTTDNNGNFNIQAPADASIVFRSLGYEEKVVRVNGQSRINALLIRSSNGLDEVVVVGFGAQKKASVIGAISTINTREIKQSPSASLSVTLAGRLPGLTSLQRTGEPGLNSIDLYIRGRSTINDQRPLLMVDGVERAIDALDPNEIESVSILKDATATAIYGVRGANGVILVTTRRGSSDKPEISVSAEKGLTDFTRFPNALGAFDYATIVNEINKSDGTAQRYTATQLEGWRAGSDPVKYPDHNWYKEFTKNFSDQDRFNMNVTGGTATMKYFVSGGYLTQGGQFKTDQTEYDANTNLKRYNFRANFDVNLTKSLKASLTSAGYLEKQNRPSAIPNFGNPSLLIINAMIAVPSNAHNILTPNGEVLSANGIPGGQPVYGLINRSGYVAEDRNSVLSTFALEQKLDFLTQGLSAKAQLSFDSRAVNTQRRDRTFARYRQDIDPSTGAVTYVLLSDVNSPLGAAQQFQFQSFSNTQLSLNYQRTFHTDHNVSALFLYNQDKRVINIELPYNLRGFVGRGTYNYKNRYFTEFNFGYNGSEQFAKGKRYGFFPSVSAGWLASEERFFKEHLSAISLFKLRASYGLSGNDRFGSRRFLYLDDYSLGGGYSNIPNSINENLIGNRDLTWETSKKLNFGLDATLYDITLNLDLFHELRDNVLINRGTIPSLYGTASFAPLNFGSIENKGAELQLSYAKKLNSNLFLNIRLNGSYAKNKINFLDEPLLNSNFAYRTRQTGFSIGQPFGLQTAGFFNNSGEIVGWADQSRYGATKPGDLKYVDQNGDNKIDDADFVPIGSPNVPLMNFGGSFSLTYKNFDFSVLIQGQSLVTQNITDQAVYGSDNLFDFHLGRWTAERYAAGEKITFPRLSYTSNMNRQPSDFYIQRSDFLRLKNAEIGYSLPIKVSGKISAKRIRFYSNGLNLFFIYDKTKFKQVDPESAQGGGNQYPLTRVINFGLNATF